MKSEIVLAIGGHLSRGILLRASLIALLATVAGPASAKTPRIVNNLDASGSIISAVFKTCHSPKKRQVFERYRLSRKYNWGQDDTIGSLGPGGTAHSYIALQSNNKDVGLEVFIFADTGFPCAFILLFKEDKDSTLKLNPTPAISVDTLPTIEEQQQFRTLKQRCEKLGNRASSELSGGGQALLDDGTVIEGNGLFTCAFAIPYNTSSVIASWGNISFRLSVIEDTLFINEVEE